MSDPEVPPVARPVVETTELDAPNRTYAVGVHGRPLLHVTADGRVQVDGREIRPVSAERSIELVALPVPGLFDVRVTFVAVRVQVDPPKVEP